MAAPLSPLTLCCDTGIDDALAIAVAAGLGLPVAAVVATAGNCPLADAAANTAGVVALCGLDAPVLLGAATPLASEHYRTDGVHGDDGVGGARGLLPAGGPVDPGGIDALRGAVVATGPLTPVALAARDGVRPDPLTWMGGAVRRAGNVTPAAEFNAWWDALAVAEVLAAGPITMLPLDVTATLPLGRADVERLAASRSATARWCATAASYRVARDGHLLLHDPAAVLSTARPDLFTWESMTLGCVTDGDEAGRTAMISAGGPHRVAVAADVEGVVGAVVEALLACP